nr:MAG TPA: hypothetical protein [Caudoviricetes sp.]
MTTINKRFDDKFTACLAAAAGAFLIQYRERLSVAQGRNTAERVHSGSDSQRSYEAK